MSVSLYTDFRAYRDSHELSELRRELLKALRSKNPKPVEALIERLGSVLSRNLLEADDIEFMKELVKRLSRSRLDESFWEDFSHAVRLTVETELNLHQLIANREIPSPIPSKQAEFGQLLELLTTPNETAELASRRGRMDLVNTTIKRRPGLYIAELYKLLRRTRAVGITYPTLWNDVRSLEREGQVMTVGGPQGNPRYCFPDPSRIENRRTYYGSYYCAHGRIEERLTAKFEFTRRYLDLYSVESKKDSLIILVQYGALPNAIEGTEVKTFGKLHDFDFLRTKQGVKSLEAFDSPDVLRAVSLARAADNQEKTLWYDPRAFSGLSLYSPSTAEAKRYSSVA